MRICLFVLMLAGCASDQVMSPKTWAKDGASEMDTRAAIRFCEKDNSPGFLAYAAGLTLASSFEDCMKDKGFGKR